MSIRMCLVALATLASLSAVPVPVHADDAKTYGLSICQPYLPGTTAGELEFGPTGIYNPGVTTEKVFCTVPRDQEETYAAADAGVVVYYRVLGAAQQRMTCTLFVGSSSMQSQPVNTTTTTGMYASSGGRVVLEIDAIAQISEWSQVPNTLVCSIPPKTSMAAILLHEEQLTDVEPASP